MRVSPDLGETNPSDAVCACPSDVRTERLGGDIFVVALVGEHDLATGADTDKALHEASSSDRTTVILDLTQTTFLDSTVLGLLLRFRSRLADGRRVAVVCDDPIILRVFEIVGLHRLFDFQAVRRTVQGTA